MNAEERKVVEKVYFPIWRKWMEELEEGGDAREVMRFFAERHGCTENSPLSLMFVAFCAGIDNGIEVITSVEAKEQQIRKPISVSSNLNEQIEPIRTAAKAAEAEES